jgi:hypothetical protein
MFVSHEESEIKTLPRLQGLRQSNQFERYYYTEIGIEMSGVSRYFLYLGTLAIFELAV